MLNYMLKLCALHILFNICSTQKYVGVSLILVVEQKCAGDY